MSKNNKSKPIFGLEKLPDSMIVKNQAVEMGILKSTIDELEYKLEEANKKLKESSVENLKKLQKKVNKLQNKVETLNSQLSSKEKSYNNLQDRFVTINRKNDLMQKELLQNLKDKKS